MYTVFAATLVALFYALAIAFALEAILKSRTSQGAIAWVISLVAFPFASVPAYLIFGRNRFSGYLGQRDEIAQKSRALIDRTQGSVAAYALEPNPDMPWLNSLFKLARMPATSGNEVQLLIDGAATFDSIEEGLRGAKKYIFFQSYIIRDDDLGRRIGRVLADKARQGLDVFLLFDEIGSPGFARSKLYRQLTMTGVRAAAFDTTQGRRNRFQLNFRNHRKIVVVDGDHAWIGGHNVGNEYLDGGKRFDHWRDTHVRMSGPAVLSAELAFATDWLWATNASLDVQRDWKATPRGDCSVLVFPSDPASEYEEAGLMYHQLIAAARQRIWIASPYFVPDNAIVSALQLAALRDVEVRILIPDKPDGPVVGLANWSFTRQLLPFGVDVYRYRKGFMHQKTLLVDDDVCGVGTANFDNRSFRLNFEVTVLVQNTPLADEVEAMLVRDMASSHRVLEEDIQRKPPWFILAMAAARLLAPVL